jgi:hypothetical protein
MPAALNLCWQRELTMTGVMMALPLLFTMGCNLRLLRAHDPSITGSQP